MNKIRAGLLFTLLLVLASAASGQLTPGSSSFLSNRNSTADRHQPLPSDQAFPYYVSIVSPTQLRVTWEISPGHYLYRHQFHFALVDADTDNPVMVDFRLPDGKPITDQFFGAVQVYYARVSAEIDFKQLPRSSEQLLIQFQGCADWGFCYPPQSDEYLLNPASNQLN